MSDHFKNIYANRATDYERLIVREDYQGNLLKTLQSLHHLPDSVVIEFGAGTGRLTRMLAPHVKRIWAFDDAPAMLRVAFSVMEATQTLNWSLGVADNRAIPLPDGMADLTIEGWSFGHLCGWYPATWREEAHKAIGEMTRLVKDGGTIILLETLGTGVTTPTPPTENLASFYAMLEGELGFTRTAVSTDYEFETLEEAVELANFFFGEALAHTVQVNQWVIMPEWTGIWSRTKQ